MVKICNYGFDESFVEEHRDMHGIAYPQNILSRRDIIVVIFALISCHYSHITSKVTV